MDGYPMGALKSVIATVVLWSLVAVKALAGNMTFIEGSAGGTDGLGWIYATGDIVESTPDDFRLFLERSKGISHPVIYLNSPGGSLWAGLELGREIRRNNLGTAVGISQDRGGGSFQDIVDGGQCVSACSYAFLGGTKRSAAANEVGIHQFFFMEDRDNPNQIKYSGSDLSEEQKKVARVLGYVVEMGVDARVVVSASQTNPSDVHWLSDDELQDYDVTYDPKQFSPWALEVYKGKLISASKTSDGKATATLYCGSKSRALTMYIVQEIDRALSQESLKSIEQSEPNLFGVYLEKPGDVLAKENGHNLEFTIRVPADIHAPTEPDEYGLGGGGPWSSLFYLNLPFENIQIHSKIILKTCS